MRYFSLVVVHRPRVSIGPCRWFTSGNMFKESYNGPTSLSIGGAKRDFHVAGVLKNPALGPSQVLWQTQSGPKVSNKKAVDITVIELGGPIAPLGDSKSGAQKSLSNPNPSKPIDNMSKEKLEKLRGHINRFFAKYPKFNHDPTKSYTEEFLRMTSEFGWSEGSEKYKIARKKLNTASVLQFNENFDKGHQEKNQKKGKMLRKWVALFNRIAIKDLVMPKTVPEFEERVKSVHTNICDVLEAGVTSGKSIDWENEVILSQYTLRTKRIFPREHPLAGSLLRHLLRHILSPSPTRGFEEEAPTQKRNQVEGRCIGNMFGFTLSLEPFGIECVRP
ncbi:hypothetical protein B0J17DRAFT_770583 [Rhizoctonia solani]|nr:hypothetical protein B0J17DRAFT_770583 [Rhizoctonia solani]